MAATIGTTLKRFGSLLIAVGVVFLLAALVRNVASYASAGLRAPFARQPEPQQPQTQTVPLEQAKEEIRKAMGSIYDALNQGDPAKAASYLSPAILSSTDKLDFICRPFTFRAYYIEAVAARTDERFQVRVRVLLKPMDERAHTIVFHITTDQVVLESAQNTQDDWYGPQKAEAGEIVRRFVYGLKAGKKEIVGNVISPNFPLANCADDEDIQRHLSQLQEVRITEVALEQTQGLHIVVTASFPEQAIMNLHSSKRFYLEPIDGELKIVRAFYSKDVGERPAFAAWRWGHYYEDPDIEMYTLKRFGLGEEPETTKPSVVSKVEPAYSVEALAANFSGTVNVSLVVGEDGMPREIRVIDSPGLGLDEKIIAAVKQWKFKSGTKNGQPVATRATIEIPFRRP